MSKEFKSVAEALAEMDHHPSDEVVYQGEEKFPEISVGNIKRMEVIREDDDYLFVKSGAVGYVFETSAVKEASHYVRPVLHVMLREGALGNLRVAKGHSQNNLAERWRGSYQTSHNPS